MFTRGFWREHIRTKNHEHRVDYTKHSHMHQKIYIASGTKPEINQKSGPDLIGPLSLLSECLYGSPGTRFTSMVLLVAGAIIA